MINLTQQPGELIVSGLSTDTKPTNVPAASVFIERDTLLQYTFTGGVWVPLVAPTLSKIKTADQSVSNSTTLADDSELNFFMLANRSYRFDIILFVTSASATPDFKFAITSTQAPQDVRYQVETWQAGVGLTLDSHTLGSAYGTEFTSNWTAAPNTYCRLQGSVANGASDASFRVQWSQRVSNATAVTVKRGSSLNISAAVN